MKAILPTNQLTSQAISTSQSTQPSSASVIHLTNGHVVDGIVVRPTQTGAQYLPPATTPNTQPPPLQASDTVRIHILSTNIASAGAPQGGSQPQQPASPQSGTATAPAQPGATAAYTKLTGAPPANPQESARQFANRNQQPPVSPAQNQPQPASVPAITNNIPFTGQVVGTERSGETVLQTPLGTIKLPAGIALPQGSQVTLEVVAHSTAAAQTAETLPGTTAQRDAIEQLIQQLSALQSSQSLPSASPHKLLPQVGKQMAARKMWFHSGISNQDPVMLLGQELHRTLQQEENKPQLTRIEQLLGRLHTVMNDANPQGWTTYTSPIYDGTKWEFVQFHVHRDPKKEKNKQSKDDDVRFVVEVEFDELGETQCDGLMHRAADKHLDLVIRAKTPWPQDIQQGVEQAFQTSNEITGIEGTLQFIFQEEFPILPFGDGPRDSNDIVV